MSQAHGYVVKVKQAYGEICRHAYMVPLARYTYLTAYAQAQSLAHNLGKRLVRRARDASLLYMPSRLAATIALSINLFTELI